MAHNPHVPGEHPPRVLLLHNFLTPYRIPLFAELAGRFDLTVWILGNVRTIREWSHDVHEDAFTWRLLPHVSLPAGSRDYRILLNPTLPRELSQEKPDTLICCGWDTPATFYAARWARGNGVPFVLWSGSTVGEPNWRRTLARRPVQWLVRGADAWLAYGSRAETYLESLGAAPERVFRAYNAVETDLFDKQSRMTSAEREQVRERFGIRTPSMVLYCGQLIERKGLGDLLPAFARAVEAGVDASLLVVGSGPKEQTFRRLAAREGVGDRTVFAGFVAREELPRLYGSADLMALPSREEVWGLVVNEALACGTPVLATDNVGAAADLLEDNVNGYVVPPRNLESLSAALIRHFADAADKTAMRGAARASIEPFSIAAAADSFEQAVACARTLRADREEQKSENSE